MLAAALVASPAPGPVTVLVVVLAFVAVTPVGAWLERRRLWLVDERPLPSVAGRRVRELGLAVLTLLALWWIDLLMIGLTAAGPRVAVGGTVVDPEVA